MVVTLQSKCVPDLNYTLAVSLQSEYMDVGYSDPGMGLPYTVNIKVTEIYLVVRLVGLVHDFG